MQMRIKFTPVYLWYEFSGVLWNHPGDLKFAFNFLYVRPNNYHEEDSFILRLENGFG